jgi:uncharacterized protein (TIGR02452 family)
MFRQNQNQQDQRENWATEKMLRISIFQKTLQASKKIQPKPETFLMKNDPKNIDLSAKLEDVQPNIEVREENCIRTLINLSRQGVEDICMLNMASGRRPGGGVTNGARAQEETLCRCSNLYPGMIQAKKEHQLYPLQQPYIIKNVTFFKDESYQMMDHCLCDVVVCNAVKMKRNESWTLEHNTITRNKIRDLVLICHQNRSKTLIFSALGCGAFNNPPEKVAELFHDVLVDEGWGKLFDRIIFSIIEDHNSDGSNLAPFSFMFG